MLPEYLYVCNICSYISYLNNCNTKCSILSLKLDSEETVADFMVSLQSLTKAFIVH